MIHCTSNNEEEGEADVAHHSDWPTLLSKALQLALFFLPYSEKETQAQCNFFFPPPLLLTMCNLSRGQHTVKRTAIVQEGKRAYSRFIAASRSLCISVYLCYCLMTTMHTHRGGEEKQILLIMWCPGMSLCKRGCQLTYHMWDKPYYC